MGVVFVGIFERDGGLGLVSCVYSARRTLASVALGLVSRVTPLGGLWRSGLPIQHGIEMVFWVSIVVRCYVSTWISQCSHYM